MRKVKYSVANSLDGFIARPGGEVDWLLMDADYGLDEFFKTIDAALLGRKTYEFALSHSLKPKGKKNKAEKSSPFDSGMKNYVFSRTMEAVQDEGMNIISDDAGDFVRDLKRQEGKDIWLMGGGELARSLLAEGVVDEISLAVHPVLLGSGIQLFPEIDKQIGLKLVQCKPHPNGVVQVTYHVKN